ncbi:uncharacterized protein V1510DRAFT_421860 [Dipodascopsis tothii]|uniref:uncharacterized protein n=1 Tax=Dipodascopsis tothii TaxID=44089 RepID=UPI0034CF577F
MSEEESPLLPRPLLGRPHPTAIPPTLGPPKQGPQRTSKVSQKLKLLPDQYPGGRADGPRVSGFHSPADARLVVAEPGGRRDGERLGKQDRAVLPRVTAYCTASSYRIKELARYIAARKSRSTDPVLYDECLYSVYSYRAPDEGAAEPEPENRRPAHEQELVRVDPDGTELRLVVSSLSEVFVFEYGVVVLWGFSEQEEHRFLRELPRFEIEKLAGVDVQIEEFNYYVTRQGQARIHNDFIALREGTAGHKVKLSISHAIAQSVKISLFEELVDHTIEVTQDIPQEIAMTGKVQMSRKKIMMSIGELFILRININLHGSILDSPELMWAEPQLEPVYQASRSYLEINQRVSLLNQRLEVISDLLQMLKEQLGHAHEEYLEFVVIVLIAVEVLVAFINIVVDFLAQGGE